MPKWGIHNIVLSEALSQMLESEDDEVRQAAEELFEHRDMAMLGAVGPDLFFFAPDYEVVEKLYKLYKNYQQVMEVYNKVVEPIRKIRDAVVEPVEDAVEELAPSTVAIIREALEEVEETTALFKSTLQTSLFAGVVDGLNVVTDAADLPRASSAIFEEFIPPMQDNEREDKWYWFDMLHYRNTGEFGKNLVELAQDGSPRQKAYAYGYLSHIATDLVGHAFVNQIVGGPYRMHSQRHTVVENFMDTRQVFEFDGTSVNQTLFDRIGLPEEYEPLDEEIVDLLHQAFIDTYQNDDETSWPHLVNDNGGPEAGFLTKDQITSTYEIFYEILEVMKGMAVKRPEEPFSGVADILEDALQDVFESPPAPPSMGGSSACSAGDILSFGLTSDSRDCYEEFFEELDDWAEYFGELFKWAVETLTDIVDLLLATFLALPLTVLMALLYGIQLLMYELYQSVRFMLSLEGFFTPEPADIESSHGRNLTTTGHCAVQPFKYPRFRDRLQSHLVCATDRIESPKTAADFYPSSNDVTPQDFIRDRLFDIKALYLYANSSGVDETRGIEKRGEKIGNAIDLTSWMISTAANSDARERDKNVAFTNWNLDSDRGYGYKTWSGIIPENANDNNGAVQNEKHTDENSN